MPTGKPKKAREPKLKFVAHFTPEECQTEEDKRAILGAFYGLHGVPMPPDVAAPIDHSKTYHGMKAREALEASRTASPVATQTKKAPRTIGAVRGATLSPVNAGGKG